MTEKLSQILTEEEKPVALDAFGLAFGINMNRALQESPNIPTYAKRPNEVVKQETTELQAELAKLAREHPETIRRMNLPLDSLLGITPVDVE